MNTNLTGLSPAVSGALARVLEDVVEGGMDVRNGVVWWGRNSEKGYGRFTFLGCRERALVPVDARLWAKLDDLAMLRRAGLVLPPGAWRIPAHAETTAEGEMRIAYGVKAPCKMVALTGKTNHGVGYIPTPSRYSLAPVVSSRGTSSGGGQAAGALLAVVSEGTPLQLASGVRYEYRPDGGGVSMI